MVLGGLEVLLLYSGCVSGCVLSYDVGLFVGFHSTVRSAIFNGNGDARTIVLSDGVLRGWLAS